jgi:thioredoxin-dependent peroxiredoxin
MPQGTTQACLFRDSYEPLTATGFSIFGLSTDSPKANTGFKEKQKLPYALLCDPSGTLISAIGLKKAPKGTTRGVFVVDRAGTVLAAEPGGPAATVEVAKKLVGSSEASVSTTTADKDKTKDEVKPTSNGVNGSSGTKDDIEKANIVSNDADAAEKPGSIKADAT